MHRKRVLLVAAITVTAAGCVASRGPRAPQPHSPAAALAPAPVVPLVASARPASDLDDHLGDSPETAVPVPRDAPNEGIDFQNNWIYRRYGRFRRSKGGIAHAGEGSSIRRYEVVTFELPDHSERTVYFDITENMLTWKHSAPRP